jgi:NADPH2:quinone reductase
MRAVEIPFPGPPAVLRLTDRPDPQPGPGEVLIDVAAAGVNRPDLMQRAGSYPPPPGASDLPGLEVAGQIAQIGDGGATSASGRRWREGDLVCALVAGGGYASRCVAPAIQCLPVPRGLSLTQAAAIPETYFTVWTNVFERGHLQSGEWLLVHGGTSGIGTTAIQIATARGARVMATCGTGAKCDAARALGASPINYRECDFVPAVMETTGGAGADVILDIVGGSYTPRNLDCLARDGRLVQIGVMEGSRAEVSLRTILAKRLTITGSTLRPRTPEEKGAIAAALEREVWPLLEHGRIRPIVHEVLPLAQASTAHAWHERGAVIGKLVLTM